MILYPLGTKSVQSIGSPSRVSLEVLVPSADPRVIFGSIDSDDLEKYVIFPMDEDGLGFSQVMYQLLMLQPIGTFCKVERPQALANSTSFATKLTLVDNDQKDIKTSSSNDTKDDFENFFTKPMQPAQRTQRAEVKYASVADTARRAISKGSSNTHYVFVIMTPADSNWANDLKNRIEVDTDFASNQSTFSILHIQVPRQAEMRQLSYRTAFMFDMLNRIFQYTLHRDDNGDQYIDPVNQTFNFLFQKLPTVEAQERLLFSYYPGDIRPMVVYVRGDDVNHNMCKYLQKLASFPLSIGSIFIVNDTTKESVRIEELLEPKFHLRIVVGEHLGKFKQALETVPKWQSQNISLVQTGAFDVELKANMKMSFTPKERPFSTVFSEYVQSITTIDDRKLENKSRTESRLPNIQRWKKKKMQAQRFMLNDFYLNINRRLNGTPLQLLIKLSKEQNGKFKSVIVTVNDPYGQYEYYGPLAKIEMRMETPGEKRLKRLHEGSWLYLAGIYVTQNTVSKEDQPQLKGLGHSLLCHTLSYLVKHGLVEVSHPIYLYAVGEGGCPKKLLDTIEAELKASPEKLKASVVDLMDHIDWKSQADALNVICEAKRNEKLVAYYQTLGFTTVHRDSPYVTMMAAKSVDILFLQCLQIFPNANKRLREMAAEDEEKDAIKKPSLKRQRKGGKMKMIVLQSLNRKRNYGNGKRNYSNGKRNCIREKKNQTPDHDR